MKRTTLCCALLAGLSLATSARADEGDGVEAGRSAARAIVIFRDPWPCATLLLAARCDADVTHMTGSAGDAIAPSIPGAGKHPISGLHDFIEHGNRDGYDRALTYINSISAPEALWKSDPAAATLFDIGGAQVLIPAAGDNFAGRVLSSGDVFDLDAHRESGELAGANEALVASIGLDKKAAFTDADGTAAALLAASFARFPEPPLGAYAYDRPAGYALYGLASAWVFEFIDNAAWLAQSDVRAFVISWADRGVALNAGAGNARDAFLKQLNARPFDHNRVLQSGIDLSSAVFTGKPLALRRQILIGNTAGQMGYNAAVLREENFGRTACGLLADIADFDAISPDVARLRKTAASLRPSDWSAQFALSRELSVAIVEANAPQ
ncbi:MAG: hypothetical protein IAI48_09380 [Candidatus Eremiobacteraeota bacterium]|nr:hypothetical protein [Candidatus Eremiobacteraeota bacterium]